MRKHGYSAVAAGTDHGTAALSQLDNRADPHALLFCGNGAHRQVLLPAVTRCSLPDMQLARVPASARTLIPGAIERRTCAVAARSHLARSRSPPSLQTVRRAHF